MKETIKIFKKRLFSLFAFNRSQAHTICSSVSDKEKTDKTNNTQPLYIPKFWHYSENIELTKYGTKILFWKNFQTANAHPRNDGAYFLTFKVVIHGKILDGYYGPDFLLKSNFLYIPRLFLADGSESGKYIDKTELLVIDLNKGCFTIIDSYKGYICPAETQQYFSCYLFYDIYFGYINSIKFVKFKEIVANYELDNLEWTSINFQLEQSKSDIKAYDKIVAREFIDNLIKRLRLENKQYIYLKDIVSLQYQLLEADMNIKEFFDQNYSQTLDVVTSLGAAGNKLNEKVFKLT